MADSASRGESGNRRGKGRSGGGPGGGGKWPRASKAAARKQAGARELVAGVGPGTAAPSPAEPPGLGARRLAAHIIDAVLGSGRTLDDALAAAGRDPTLSGLEARDRGFAHLIAATVLRRAGSLGHVLGRFLERPLPSAARRTRAILLSAAAQILLVGTPAHAAVSLAVEQCRRDRAAGRYARLANAVLRRVAADGPTILAGLDAAREDVPPWLLARWVAAHGKETALAIARASLAEAPLDLSPKVSADAPRWAELLHAELLATGSIRLREHDRIEDLAGYADGAWWVQDAAAALPGKLLGDVSGRAIADLCAAPGGKTAALAAAGADVTAVDVAAERLERLRTNMARLALEGRVEVVAADLAVWRPDRHFDAVLLDAPCTATGTIRRHPDILHLKRRPDMARLAGIELRLIERAASLVRPGGQLVYCVCSLEPEEGPGVVTEFLARNNGFTRRPVTVDEMLALGGEPAWLTEAGDLRTLPCHTPRLAGGGMAAGGMDGFYAARLQRTDG